MQVLRLVMAQTGHATPHSCARLTLPPPPQVLRLVVRLYEGVPRPDLSAVCQCLMLLGDADEVAAILARLLG